MSAFAFFMSTTSPISCGRWYRKNELHEIAQSKPPKVPCTGVGHMRWELHANVSSPIWSWDRNGVVHRRRQTPISSNSFVVRMMIRGWTCTAASPVSCVYWFHVPWVNQAWVDHSGGKYGLFKMHKSYLISAVAPLHHQTLLTVWNMRWELPSPKS